MKAMISQPMNGLSDEEINDTKERATKFLNDLGYEVVNTLFTDDFYNEENLKNNDVKHIGVFFLGKSLEEMSKVDAVYFCHEWENTRGCLIEHQVAKCYGVKILYELV